MKKWTWKVNVTAIAAIIIGGVAVIINDVMLLAFAGIVAYISQGD
jgi:hypothetical protein